MTTLPLRTADLPTSPSVPLLRWPDEEPRRRALAADRRPRLLLVSQQHEPPQSADPLEDWLRDPPEPADLVTRLAALGQRAEALRSLPRIDEDGLLWCDNRWVVIPDQQLVIAHLLIEHANQLVRTSTITAAYVRTGGSGHRASIKTMLNRLAGRFEEVGLVLRFVRGKGVLLEVPGAL